MAYLIDTDIIIYSLKGDSHVSRNFTEQQDIPKAISIITYGELLYGAKKSKLSAKNSAAIYRLAENFPIIGISRSVMEAFTDIKLILERGGQRVPDLDLLIAATALSHGYTLVSNNTRHFSRIAGLKLENWAE